MAIKADRWIRQMSEAHHMIEPFSSSQVAEGTISYGLSSYGYDLRLADEFKIFTPPAGAVLNPKAIPADYYRAHKAPFCDIPPSSYVLGRTVEYLRIPRDVNRIRKDLDRQSAVHLDNLARDVSGFV